MAAITTLRTVPFSSIAREEETFGGNAIDSRVKAVSEMDLARARCQERKLLGKCCTFSSLRVFEGEREREREREGGASKEDIVLHFRLDFYHFFFFFLPMPYNRHRKSCSCDSSPVSSPFDCRQLAPTDVLSSFRFFSVTKRVSDKW